MIKLKPFYFYGYYVTISRYHNTNKHSMNVYKWTYHFKVYKKSKNVLTLNRDGDDLSKAKKSLLIIMLQDILLEKEGKSYYMVKGKKEIKFRKFLSEHEVQDLHINRKDIPLSVLKKNRIRLLKQYKSGYLILYRGIGYGDERGGYMDTSKYSKTFERTSSWTTSKQVAYNFSEHPKHIGIIITAKFNIRDILISYHTMSNLVHEREVIVKAYPKINNFKVYDHKEFKKRYNLKERWT